MNLIERSKFDLLERTLDAASLRQKVIANNIANADVPKFKRSDVRFEDFLQQELQATDTSIVGYRTDPRHFIIRNRPPAAMPQVIQDEFSIMNNNLNNVDIDYEMALMAKNQLRYNTIVGQVNQELRQLRTAIEGR